MNAIEVLVYAGVSGRGLVGVVGEQEKWQEEWGVVLQVVAGNQGKQCTLDGGVVVWKSYKQSTTAMFAAEAEYIAASEATMEAVWIRKFISGLGIVPP
uniref:Putative retrotransposon protein n=1 Tax=Tanacetum cinerariifolium TaxID=118510 RepID=A0A699HUW9_TANCI|nr:putative retrotransposon protein [Tanacetum cinerariifolium]